MLFRYFIRHQYTWITDVLFVVFVIGVIGIFNKEHLTQLTNAKQIAKFAQWTKPHELGPEDNDLPELPEADIATLDLSMKNKPNIKMILQWTRWYGMEGGMTAGFGFGPDVFMHCPVSNCRTSSDRRLANVSHAIMFHLWPDFKGGDDLPAHRWPQQRYIFNYFEPPGNPNKTGPFSEIPPNFFNWTFTFRRDSDIPSNIYGDYQFISNSMDRQQVGEFDQEESLDNYYGVNITGKKIMVAWFSSHCPTHIKREEFAKELGKYVQVDIYGRCGGDQAKTCKKRNVPGGEDCDDLLRQDYLFYLAMENSICHDYVTEKFYRGLRADTVPIVFGGVHYSRFAPPHSYINAFDYESPKQLADYLIQLSNNRRLYAHYFEWKRHFKIVHNPSDAWCKLCAKLNDPNEPPKVYEDLNKWWYWSRPCQYDYKWRLNNTRPVGLRK